MKIIITTSGIGSRLGDITNYLNKSLVRVGNKCPIDYIFDNYKDIKDVEFIITLGYKGDIVKQYINLVYQNELCITFVEIDNYKGPGSSLGYSLLQVKKNININEPFIFHCCDSIFFDKIDINFKSNTLFCSIHDDSTQYSSLNVIDQRVTQINEKGYINHDYIYCGVAYIHDHDIFWEKLKMLYEDNKYKNSLSDIHSFKKMLSEYKFNSYELKEYYDMGNLNSYQFLNKKLNCKYNVLLKLRESIYFLDNKVVKYFYDENINKKRLERIKFIGNKLIPKILSHTKNFHSMELIDSKPLSEIFEPELVYKLLNWSKKNLWIENVSVSNFENVCYDFYYNKTMKRIKQYFSDKKNVDYININNTDVKDIYTLLKKIDFKSLCKDKPCNYHGDFILDNILKRENNEFSLIDWRQDFGGDIERGDKYYDLAKLQHNLHFNHKNINEGLYYIKRINEESCLIDMKCNYSLVNRQKEFDKFVINNKLNQKKIDILNGLIWINMSPLHTYPLSNFLFNLGKLKLHNTL